MRLKKDLTIDDFQVHQYVDWEQIAKIMGKRRFKKFKDWMFGQTCSENGVYPWDLERYLNRVLKGKSTYFD
jgi:hypothetical protein